MQAGSLKEVNGRMDRKWCGAGTVLTAALLVGWPGGMADACTFCAGGVRSRPTWRLQAAAAPWVLYGTLANPRIDPVRNAGSTDFHVREVLQGEAGRAPPSQIVLPVYLPVIGNATPRDYVVLAAIRNGEWEVLGGFPAPVETVRYLRGVLQLPKDEPAKRIAYFFRYLDHADPAVAADAFAELARASDAELVLAARQGAFTAARLRQWLQDAQTPEERRGLFGYLLGLCGQAPADAEFLRQQWRRWSAPPVSEGVLPSAGRDSAAGSGLLTGLILLDPVQGWREAEVALETSDRSFSQRWAVLETLRFFQSFRAPAPTGTRERLQESPGLRRDHRAELLRCYSRFIEQGDLADQAVEDLRRWGWWELTGQILRQFDRPTHQAPIVRRAIVRYALCAPGPQAQRWVQELRQREPELVRSVEELLRQQ